MANPVELHNARRKADDAAEMLYRIRQLPQQVGDSVRWPHNGVVWNRAGDDDWRTDSMPDHPYPSEHIARLAWEVVTHG